jgi:hypothetical protein
MTTLVFVTGFCIVAVLVYMARYSGRVRLEQVRLIDAPSDAVYAKVADLAQWQRWNPWMDTQAAPTLALTTCSDQAGSHCTWAGDTSGAGFVEHVRLLPRQSIEQRLRLKQPFPVTGRSDWTFKDVGGKTEVRWRLRGRVAFFMRAFSTTVKASLALDCRYGLDQLAGLLEPPSAPRYAIEHLGVHEVTATHYVYKTYQGSISGLPQALHSAVAELRQQLADLAVPATGEPLAIYFKTNVKLRTTVCHIGIPIGNASEAGAMQVRQLAALQAYTVRLQGSPQSLEIAWYQAMQRMVAEKIKPDQRLPPFERYLVEDNSATQNGSTIALHVPVLPA